jgi:hypothetical protein
LILFQPCMRLFEDEVVCDAVGRSVAEVSHSIECFDVLGDVMGHLVPFAAQRGLRDRPGQRRVARPTTCGPGAVLATSQEPLGIGGEQIYRLAPLSLPTGDATSPRATPPGRNRSGSSRTAALSSPSASLTILAFAASKTCNPTRSSKRTSCASPVRIAAAWALKSPGPVTSRHLLTIVSARQLDSFTVYVRMSRVRDSTSLLTTSPRLTTPTTRLSSFTTVMGSRLCQSSSLVLVHK